MAKSLGAPWDIWSTPWWVRGLENIPEGKSGGGYLPSKHEALISNPSTIKKKKKERKGVL
jgi:hypothetical protein